MVLGAGHSPSSSRRPRRIAATRAPSSSLWLVLLLLLVTAPIEAGKPAPAQFFDDAVIDHFADDTDDGEEVQTFWSQRYYTSDEHFGGPGSPIFCIFGGESNIEPSYGLIYPFVTDRLAATFGAYVVVPEHRFYGQSQPINRADIDAARQQGLADPREKLLTYEQAIADAVLLVQTIQADLGCAGSRHDHDTYCPVIAVGGSYPGFLAAMARIIHPDVFDMAYAGSAPMKFYAQQVHQFAYYQHIATVNDRDVLPGCSNAVRTALGDVHDAYRADPTLSKYEPLGICPDSVPDYCQDNNNGDIDTFLDEVSMMVAYSFANHNMAYYPPSKNTKLYRACELFTAASTTTIDEPTTLTTASSSFAKVRAFLLMSLAVGTDEKCFRMTDQVPDGPNATISAGDWSGVGSGISGDSWDFQTCTLHVEAIGLIDDMFPYRPWSLEWLTNHCQRRFGVTPRPMAIDQKYRIQNIEQITSHIIFTNGLRDGWSVSGIQHNLTDTLVALNFPNGAHHSDLSGKGPSEDDTDDIRRGFDQIEQILGTWLASLSSSDKNNDNNSIGVDWLEQQRRVDPRMDPDGDLVAAEMN
jgi:lysosomal Pro-X carboxypeptidase